MHIGASYRAIADRMPAGRIGAYETNRTKMFPLAGLLSGNRSGGFGALYRGTGALLPPRSEQALISSGRSLPLPLGV